jgi:DNA-binding FadR family transcriptional regulator
MTTLPALPALSRLDVAPLPPRATAVDACARALREAILRGQVSPGERLPPERALAASFGVNRVTVRGALARLEAEGLVSPRQGSGYRVHDYRQAGRPDLIASLVELARSRQSIAALAADLLLVRRQLARAVLERLARSRKADVGPVTQAAAAFVRRVDEGADVEALAEADLAVARALARATGSDVLELCMNPVATLVAELPALKRAMYRQPRKNAQGYALLQAWLPSRDPRLVEPIVQALARMDLGTLRALSKGRRT